MSFRAEDVGELTLLVVLHSAATPPPEDWARFEALIREETRRAGPAFQRIRSLVISDGGAPNTAQRHTMQNEIWQGRPMKMSLLTTSLKNPIKRGVATALTWMNPSFKICAPHDLHSGLAHLELLFDLEHVWQVCGELQAQMAPLETLAAIADALKHPPWPGCRTKQAG